MKKHLLNLTVLLMVLAIIDAKAQDSRAYAQEDIPLSPKLEAQNPREAWKEIERAADHFPASSHSETSGSLPAGKPRTKYIESWLLATADKAREFYTKFPNDANAAAAKKKELEVLWQAIDETYATNQFSRFFVRANAILKDAQFDRTNRFNICNLIFVTAIQNRNLLSSDIDFPAELQEAARIAGRDFHDLGAVHLFSWIAEDIKTEKNRPMFREFAADLQKMSGSGAMSGFPYRMLVQVLSLQRQAIGRPISFQFAALDGHAVDTAVMKGKVVAIIFWGTSYPECIPNVLRLEDLYKKYHAKGLEVIGVNVDRSSETLKKFVSDHKIASAQYWDGKEMENKIVQASRAIRAGTILLIDKKGLLYDMNGDAELNKKVEALLVGD